MKSEQIKPKTLEYSLSYILDNYRSTDYKMLFDEARSATEERFPNDRIPTKATLEMIVKGSISRIQNKPKGINVDKAFPILEKVLAKRGISLTKFMYIFE